MADRARALTSRHLDQPQPVHSEAGCILLGEALRPDPVRDPLGAHKFFILDP
jgi:hypothetical protein